MNKEKLLHTVTQSAVDVSNKGLNSARTPCKYTNLLCGLITWNSQETVKKIILTSRPKALHPKIPRMHLERFFSKSVNLVPVTEQEHPHSVMSSSTAHLSVVMVTRC